MELKIKIKTPKGQASKTEARIKPFIGIKKTKHKTFVSPNDDTIYWEVEGSVKDILRIQRNVNMFDSVVKNIFSHKLMKSKLAQTRVDGIDELKDMLHNHTTVEIIKKATADEIVEGNITMWQKMKKMFKFKNAANN